ncbi:MAG: A/G-specific adenine glycosylase [Actinomycetota bacterium]
MPRVAGADRLDVALRDWYEPRRRAFPWRRSQPDPYHVLVSEVMLQQTQAARVVHAFRGFIERFPTIAALARAPRVDVLRQWDGLGYNRRAIALSEAARAIVAGRGGRVPRDPEDLRALPGIGPYTAAAIASIAYGEPTPAIDVNVGRIVARVRLGGEAHEHSAEEVAAAARGWIDRNDPGSWNQALMDLGREVCRPRPRCASCPLSSACRFAIEGGVPSRPPRSQPRFEGSDRQVRGAVVRELRGAPGTLGGLARSTGHRLERVATAVAALHDEGLVSAGPGALAGKTAGRVRLGS